MTAATLPDTIASVFINEQLERRPRSPSDHQREKAALQDLATHLGEAPDLFLPHFVDLAMEMTGGISAGLSLYEGHPAPGVFRWSHLRGSLATFENALTPRDFSPCGITLDRDRPTLCSHPERVYDWISDAGIEVPEVLLVPLRIEGKALGTLWIVSDREGHFNATHARIASELAAFVGVALRILRSEHKLQQAVESQELVAREMHHRLNNVFTLTDVMIRMTAKTAQNPAEMADLLSGRLYALAQAHQLVQRNVRDLHEGESSNLAALIRTIIQPHEASFGRKARFTVRGGPVPCGESAVNGLALVLHELATNAAKYGALAGETGRVEISWQSDGTVVMLNWVELGGAEITGPPRTSGFGSRLIQSTITRQFGGALTHDWRREGLAVTMTLPLDRLSD